MNNINVTCDTCTFDSDWCNKCKDGYDSEECKEFRTCGFCYYHSKESILYELNKGWDAGFAFYKIKLKYCPHCGALLDKEEDK